MTKLTSLRTSLRPRGRRARVGLEKLEDRLCLTQDLLVSGFNSNNVHRYDRDTGAPQGIFTSSPINSPTDMNYGPDGNLYVTGFANEVRRYDGETGAFLGVFVPPGSGGLVDPRGLAFGPDGNLYVTSANSSVKRYDGTTGAFLGNFVSGGSLGTPLDMSFGPDGNLYVGNFPADNVLRYDGVTGAFLGVFASGGGLSGAWDPVFGPDGNLYVSSYNNNQIKRYDGTTGAFIDTFVTAGSGGLSLPFGITFGPDGNLYVTSFDTNQVKRYSGTTGAFLDNFASGGGISGPVTPLFPGGGTTVGGPIIVNHAPQSALETISSIRVTFSRPMDAATFTAADVTDFEGPLGPIGVTGVTPVGTAGTQFDVSFPLQVVTGLYALTLGPDIRDRMGNPMDQDRDGTPGEFDDRYVAQFVIEGARITAAQRTAMPGVDRLRLTFNRAMDPASFTDKWIYLIGPSGGIPITGAEAVAGSGNRQIDVLFPPQDELGTYFYTVLPGIRDVWGNPSDQNGNNIGGEIPADNFSSSFEVAISRNLEDFESGNLSRYTVVFGPATAQVTAGAAHDGAFGLRDFSGGDWIYRNDAEAQVAQGDTLSVWVRVTSGPDTGRAYFAFGASASGTMSLVIGTNTNEMIIQYNPAYGFDELARVNQTFVPDQWYRMEVVWGVGGNIVGRLYGADGTTLLNTVTANHNLITSGGIGFRAFGNDWHWDTVTAGPGGPGPVLGGGQSEGRQADSALALTLAASNRPEMLLNAPSVNLANAIVPQNTPAQFDFARTNLSQDAILELISAKTARQASGDLFTLALTSL